MNTSSLLALPTAVIDLAMSMSIHSYPTDEICRRTGLTPEQLALLAEELKWQDQAPLYDRRIVDSGATPAIAREFYRLVTAVQAVEPPKRGDVKDLRKQLSPITATWEPGAVIEKGLSCQLHILRLVEQGTPAISAFGAAGFDQGAMEAWLLEDRHFAASIARATAAYGQGLVRRIEAAAVSDWKAASWLLANHPHTKELFAPKLEGSGGNVLQVQLNFRRGEEISTAVIESNT